MTRATAKRKLASLLRAALREGQRAIEPLDPPTNHALLRKIERVLVRNARQTRGK